MARLKFLTLIAVILKENSIPVSIKHGLRTTDYGLRTGYKTRTKHYGLGIKYGLRYKRGPSITEEQKVDE